MNLLGLLRGIGQRDRAPSPPSQEIHGRTDIVILGGAGGGGGARAVGHVTNAYALLVVFEAASEQDAKDRLSVMLSAMPPCVYELSGQGWRFQAPFKRLQDDLDSWVAGGGKGTTGIGGTG